MTQKTNKSYAKRIKVSKNGKLTTRKKGQNHFNAKKSGQDRMQDRNSQTITLQPDAKARFLPHA